MRLRNLQMYPLKIQKTEEDEEANKITKYVEIGTIEADIHPMSGRTQAELYGIRLAYMLVAYTQKNEMTEQHVIEYGGHNYKVISVAHWGSHYVLDLERVL